MKPAQMRVVLTGAGGGIGRAATEALLRSGASVLMVGRSAERLLRQRQSLEQAGLSDNIDCQVADMTQASDLAALAARAIAWNCNVVVHNAGVPSFGRLEATGPVAMAEVLNTNLLAPMVLTQMLLPHLRGLPQARVLFVGSVLGRLGIPGYGVYSASKFGLRGFAEALRRELAGTGVAVQYLGPRSTRTGFNSEEADAFNRATGTRSDSAAVVADALLGLLQSGRAERFLGFPEKLAVRINGLAPGLLDGAFAKHRDSLPPLPHPAAHDGPASRNRT